MVDLQNFFALQKGYMFTISHNCQRRCVPWKEEAIIGLKNAAKQKG
jgi:hypothetical protein